VEGIDLHASRFIAALAGATAFGALTVAAQGQTTQPAPVTSMAPLPGAHPGANADTPPPAIPGVPRPGDSAGPEGVPLAPVHTMAPRPLSSGGTAPGGTPPGGTGPNLDPNTAPGRPVTNVRALAAHRTATGYVLSGQAQVSDGCQAARFDAVGQAAGPSAFAIVQYRNPRNAGMMCTQMVRWVSASRTVTSAKPPASVTVRTAAGTQRVPVR
jgi:hypothetical protein